MAYSLVFTKVTPTSPFAGVGFAGNIMHVMHTLLQIPEDAKLWVDMETNPTINTDSTIYFTKNVWEYYFEQILKPEEIAKSLSRRDIKRMINYTKVQYTNTSPIITRARQLFFKNFSIRKEILDCVQQQYEKLLLDRTSLGVQIRLTDMAKYHKVAGVAAYIRRIKQIMKQQPQIDTLFVATDDSKVFEAIAKEIQIPIVYQEDICRATEQKPMSESYARYYDTNRNGHRYLLGKEVLIDALLLSRCDFLLKADTSSVSQLAIVFGKDIKKVYNL